MPDDPDDPGDASIELAVFFGKDAEAAQALCWQLVSHLGLPAQAFELPAGT